MEINEEDFFIYYFYILNKVLNLFKIVTKTSAIRDEFLFFISPGATIRNGARLGLDCQLLRCEKENILLFCDYKIVTYFANDIPVLYFVRPKNENLRRIFVIFNR